MDYTHLIGYHINQQLVMTMEHVVLKGPFIIVIVTMDTVAINVTNNINKFIFHFIHSYSINFINNCLLCLVVLALVQSHI